MLLRDIYNKNKQPVISFEVFPPRTAEGLDNLLVELQKLLVYKPGLLSVTYGAGGTSQERSLLTLERIAKEVAVPVMAHVTCIGSSTVSVSRFLQLIEAWGVENILALRGDFPKNNPEYKPESDVFKYAIDLVSFAQGKTQQDIAVAGFPEGHPESTSADTDLRYLVEKVAAGAQAVFTQLFLEPETFLRFRDRAVTAGINVPIIPGIWTFSAKEQLNKLPEIAPNARIPQGLADRILSAKTESEVKDIGVAYTVDLCEKLIAAGVSGLHLYCLNKSEIVSRVLDSLNFKK